MIVTIITVIYKQHLVAMEAKAKNKNSFESSLGTIMVVSIFLPIILSLEFMLFLFLTGREVFDPVENSSSSGRFLPDRRNLPDGRNSPLVIDTGRPRIDLPWGISVQI